MENICCDGILEIIIPYCLEFAIALGDGFTTPSETRSKVVDDVFGKKRGCVEAGKNRESLRSFRRQSGKSTLQSGVDCLVRFDIR